MIDAELDPRTATLQGTERITYRNASPDTLRSVLLNLYQNIFSEGVPRNRYAPVTGGIVLKRVSAGGKQLPRRPASLLPVEATPDSLLPGGYAVRGTLARVALPAPLLPGDSTFLEIDWHFKIPPETSFRTGWEDTLGARAMVVAQWYPQVAMYDDLSGWDATPYLGDGEFYLPYGDFEVALALPERYLAGATGTLLNPGEVLTDEALRRLRSAPGTDSIVQVVTAADVEARNATRRAPDGQLVWRFRAENVRDFAFATSRGYVWDVLRAPVPADDGTPRYILAHALYRPGAAGWPEAARYAAHAISFFSQELVPYLYPQVTVAEGPIGGMEYPQIVFIGKPRSEKALYDVIAHEVAHEWFPMMVGQDEAAYAWMDEGSATYLEALASSDFWDNSDPLAADRDAYLRVAGTAAEVPMMRHTDLVSPYGARTTAAYRKPAVMFGALQSVLGDELFWRAWRTYTREWLLGHPAPWDLFATFERVSGRELGWFFYPWYFGTGVLDQAITSVVQPDSASVRVTIEDRGDNPAPSRLVVTTADGSTATATIPVAEWLHHTTATATLPVNGRVVRVELDPAHIFPDVERGNNVWTAPGR